MSDAVALRAKPLDPKRHLPVYLAWELPDLDDKQPPAQRAVAHLESSLAESEQVEHHFRAAVSATNESARDAQVYIPTPGAPRVVANYFETYRLCPVDPVQRITFSRTVEECIGSPYCMDEKDEEWVAQYNETARRGKKLKLTEDAFEATMSIFERQVAKQDSDGVTPPLEEIRAPSLTMTLRKAMKAVYPYWARLNKQRNGRPLMPQVELESVVPFF